MLVKVIGNFGINNILTVIGIFIKKASQLKNETGPYLKEVFGLIFKTFNFKTICIKIDKGTEFTSTIFKTMI